MKIDGTVLKYYKKKKTMKKRLKRLNLKLLKSPTEEKRRGNTG